MACTDYKIDKIAATFGQCTCGYSRAAHDEKKVNPAKVARNSLHVTEKDSPERPTGKQDEACANFSLDTSATAGFGQCLCGHPKTAHNTLTENPAAAALSRLNRGSVTKTEGNDVAKAPDPCSDYKLDKAASEFGMCTCGHARAVHREAPTRVDNELAQELARKKRHAEGDFTPQASGEDPIIDGPFDPDPTPVPPPTSKEAKKGGGCSCFILVIVLCCVVALLAVLIGKDEAAQKALAAQDPAAAFEALKAAVSKALENVPGSK